MPDQTQSILDLLVILVAGTLPALVVGLTLQIRWLRQRRIAGSVHLTGLLLVLAGTALLTLGLTLVFWLLAPGWLTGWMPHLHNFLLDTLLKLAVPSALGVTTGIALTRWLLSGRGGTTA